MRIQLAVEALGRPRRHRLPEVSEFMQPGSDSVDYS
jgi:hypothetical protein